MSENDVDSEEIEVEPPPTPSASERTKAAKLRLKVKAGQPLGPKEARWLNDYEKARDDARESMGASRTHEVNFTEKTAEAIGVGDTAAAMAAAAAMTREEGRREDSLARIGMEMLKASAEMCRVVTEGLYKRQESMERVVVQLMGSWRAEYLGRTHDTADRILADAEHEAEQAGGGDAISKLAEQLLPLLAPALLSKMGGGK